MKASIIHLLTDNKEKTDNFSNEVKTTLANVFNYKRSKSFISADLWNIQRRKKSLLVGKHLFY